MSFTRPRRRKIKGNAYAHRALISRTAVQQRGEQLAMLGTLLAIVAVIFASVGLYQDHFATAGVDLKNLEDTPEVRAQLTQAIMTVQRAKVIANIGGLAMLIGGGCITSALLLQRFRKRWFFFSTLGHGLILLFVPYVGSIFAFVWLVALFLARREFFLPIPSATSL